MTTKVPKVEYYYINSHVYTPNRIRSLVNLSALADDIERGVTLLTEDAYTQHYGVTQTSLAFALAVKRYTGEQVAKRAVMTYSQKHYYTLRLETFNGFTFVFKGVAGGYYGEGSRGAHDILKLFGFDNRQCSVVFEKEKFELRKLKM